MNFRFFLQIFLSAFLSVAAADLLYALEYIEFTKNGSIRREEGRFLIEAENGHVFEGRDGQYYVLSPETLLSRKSDEVPYSPLSKKELLQRLKNEFPESQGYNILVKEHFFIVYTTSKGFAGWYGQLLEKLYTSFINFWKGKGIVLDKLRMPMVALVFSNRVGFFNYAASEGVPVNPQICAYYNKLTNRVVLCDFSGIETLREGNDERADARAIQQFLRQPNAVFNIALVIHEATHQIGFNCGLHSRFAPYPLWVCEGIALFHEVPDRNNRLGWSIKPKPNDLRLKHLKDYLRKRPRRPLQEMIESDRALLNPETALDNYAMAWGLTYYLIMKRPREFSDYLKKLAGMDILTEYPPEARLKEFEAFFGDNWDDLYKDCGDYLLKL